MTLLWVAVGGAVGALGRYGLSQAWRSSDSPVIWGTLAANWSGALLIGLLVATMEPGNLKTGLITGVLGALTTFSTLALETVLLGGAWGATYLVSTSVIGVGLCYLGLELGKRLH